MHPSQLERLSLLARGLPVVGAIGMTVFGAAAPMVLPLVLEGCQQGTADPSSGHPPTVNATAPPIGSPETAPPIQKQPRVPEYINSPAPPDSTTKKTPPPAASESAVAPASASATATSTPKPKLPPPRPINMNGARIPARTRVRG